MPINLTLFSQLVQTGVQQHFHARLIIETIPVWYLVKVILRAQQKNHFYAILALTKAGSKESITVFEEVVTFLYYT